MNSTISVKALLTALLGIGFVAASVFAIIFYQRNQTLTMDLNDTKEPTTEVPVSVSPSSKSAKANEGSAFGRTSGKPAPTVARFCARG